MTNNEALLTALGAVSIGMFNMMKIVEVKNGVRNTVMNVSKDGKDIPSYLKEMMVRNEFKPMTIGVDIYLLVFSIALLSIPHLSSSDGSGGPSWWLYPTCYLASALGCYALYVDATISFREYHFMLRFIDKERDQRGDGDNNGAIEVPVPTDTLCGSLIKQGSQILHTCR
jgi:hypothetical protein